MTHSHLYYCSMKQLPLPWYTFHLLGLPRVRKGEHWYQHNLLIQHQPQPPTASLSTSFVSRSSCGEDDKKEDASVSSRRVKEQDSTKSPLLSRKRRKSKRRPSWLALVWRWESYSRRISTTLLLRSIAIKSRLHIDVQNNLCTWNKRYEIHAFHIVPLHTGYTIIIRPKWCS